MTPEQRARLEQPAGWVQEETLTPSRIEMMAGENHAAGKLPVYDEDGEYIGQAFDIITGLAVIVLHQRAHIDALEATVERQGNANERLGAQTLALRVRAVEAEQERDALAERVKHLLDTIEVERTGRKEATAERDALERRATTLRIAIDDVLGHDGHTDDTRVTKLRAVVASLQTRAEQAERTAAALQTALEWIEQGAHDIATSGYWPRFHGSQLRELQDGVTGLAARVRELHDGVTGLAARARSAINAAALAPTKEER